MTHIQLHSEKNIKEGLRREVTTKTYEVVTRKFIVKFSIKVKTQLQ